MSRRAFELVGLDRLMALSRGRPEVRVGLVDGAVEGKHPALAGALIEAIGGADGAGGARCLVADSIGCRHGTFLASLLVGNGALDIHGICPGAGLLSLPIFAELPAGAPAPSIRPERVADAVHRLLDAQVDVINLSVGIASGSPRPVPELIEACDRAQAAGTPVVAASGNQGRVGPLWLFSHPWVIPVAACLPNGAVDLRSNLGPSVGRRGLAAPATGVRGAFAPDKAGTMGGSSVATAFVTGTLALLRSLHPRLPGERLRDAVLLDPRRRRSIVPPLLDAAGSLEYLAKRPA